MSAMRVRRLPAAMGRTPTVAGVYMDVPGRRLARGRRIAVRAVAVLAMLAFNFMLVFVLGDALGRVGEGGALAQPGSVEARIGAEHPAETVHVVGAAAAVVIGVVGLAGLVARPDGTGSATHVLMSAMAWLAAAAIVGDPDNHGGMAGPVDLAFAVLALPSLAVALVAAPWRGWRRAAGWPAMIALAVAATPWLWYGVTQGFLQRYTWPPLADPHHQAHWFTMALTGLLIVFVTTGAAWSGAGRLAAASTAGMAAMAVATASLIDREAGSALPVGWAVAALVWGIATFAVTARAWVTGRRGAERAT